MGVIVGISMGVISDSIRVVGEQDFLGVIHVARATWQYWDRQGLVTTPETGLFGEEDVVDGVVAGLLASALDLTTAISCWQSAREGVIGACLRLPLDEHAVRLDAVVDPHTLSVQLTSSADDLLSATTAAATFTRHWIVLPLGPLTQEARRAFWVRARPPKEMARDRRRRPHRQKKAGRQPT